MTCESKDVIYVITCAGCNEYYISEPAILYVLVCVYTNNTLTRRNIDKLI